jgi:uncharacterized membrane protein
MRDAENWLARWQSAGLLDEKTAAAIRAYEVANVRPGNRRWQVMAAIILGAILLGAGVLLFVAAHWDAVSPIVRMVLVLTMLCFFHALGLLTRSRFAAFATAMHAVGTISAGAAIALIGQIFNMQEHWPAAVMLWALCAAAGWVLLRDQFQQSLTLLLLPAWILSEWMDRSSAYGGATTYLARLLALIATVYLIGFLHIRKRAVYTILFTAGALMLPCAVMMLSGGWSEGGQPALPFSLRIWAVVLILLTLYAGWFLDRGSLPALLAVGAVVWALPWAQTNFVEKLHDRTWSHSEPNTITYLLVAGICVLLVWWGIHKATRALVNYGVAAFALTVLWFYFSSVMNKLANSIGLIVLGVLFLAGGWLLERMRRRIVAGIESGGVR